MKGNTSISKLSFKNIKRLDPGVRENNIEVHEDLEQSEKLQEIIDILVAAGYFRARIKNLSAFDKVVGGMVWCIEFCNAEVDVDLLFQENLTIGQKIALTEKIVAVLPQIQCPHLIEPHQIQGLDFINIYPVIQWLVKRSMEFRKEASNSCYSYAIHQFDKYFSVPKELTQKQKNMLTNIETVNEFYRPHRVLKRKSAIPFKDIDSKVQITLLEYGYKTDSKLNKSEDNSKVQETGVSVDNIDQIMENVDTTIEEPFDYNLHPADEREKIAEHYKKLKMEFEDPTDSTKSSVIEYVQEDLTHKFKDNTLLKDSLNKQIDMIKTTISELKLEQTDLEEATKRLESDGSNSEKFNEVERLLLQGDNLDKQKIEFEEQCQAESHLLKTSIESLGEKSISATGKCNELDSKIAEEESKLNDLRLEVAKMNRAVSVLLRKIDEVPSRSELAQYQKRFIELYNEISSKHKETKQFYTLYNSLEDTRQFLKKELSLFNSIIDNFPEAVRSKERMEEFCEQFKIIHEGYIENKLKLEKRNAQEKRKRDELSDTLHSHHEMNRKYATAIKVLKSEFQKNEDVNRNAT